MPNKNFLTTLNELKSSFEGNAHSDELIEKIKILWSEQYTKATGEHEVYSAVLDNIVDGLVTISSTGVIENFNQSAEKIFGYKEMDVVGKSFKILMPESYQNEYEVYLYNYIKTGEKKIMGKVRELTGQRRDGSSFPMELIVNEVSIHNVPHFVGIARDISERKLAETELYKASRRLSLAVESASLAIWEFDLVTNELIWDERMYEIYGVSKTNFTSAYDTWQKGLHPDDRERSEKEFKECLENPEKRFDTAFRIIRPNGEIRHVKAWGLVIRDETGVPEHVIGINMDITSQKLAENKTMGLEAELESVFNSVIDGLVIIDKKGTVSAFNPAAGNIFGYSEEEVIGENVKMLMPEPYYSEHDGYLKNYMDGGKAKIIGIGREVRGRHKDGNVFPLSLAVTKIQNIKEQLFVGMVRDLTEQKRLEKLKNEFVSTVSHELRTPLTSIRGSLSLIDSGVMGIVGDKIAPLVQIALSNSERLIMLINDILDMEKIESGMMNFELEQTDMNSMIQQAVESNEGYAKAHEVSLSFDPPDMNVQIYVDVNRIQQVLTNLISNAVKYSPKHDVVSLSVVLSNRRVHVAVHDNGSGVPEAFKKQIFQKFAQADSSDTKQKGGTGLGLNITKAIVEKFGGTIGFVSPEGEGATFFFELPIVNVVDNNETLLKQVRGKVLIVEDDHDIATLLQIMLQDEELECDVAYNAKQAKILLQKNKYDAMTLDILLPDQDGISLLNDIRKDKSFSDLAVVVVSVKALKTKEEHNAVALKVVDWINKPIDQEQLIASMNKAMLLNDNSNHCILHVEDDADIAHLVKILIGDLGDIDLAKNKSQALSKLKKQEKYDLILLDMMLPDGSAEELLPYIKEHYKNTPVVLFSAQEVDNKLKDQVAKALVKSRTSNALFIETIKKIIQDKSI